MKSFGEYFSYLQFVRVITFEDFNPRPTVPSNDPAMQVWYDAMSKNWDETCREPVRVFISQLFADKVFKPIANHCDRERHIGYAWEESLNSELTKPVLSAFIKYLRYELMVSHHTKNPFKDKYQSLIASMDSGNYTWFTTSLSSKCDRTGEVIWLDIQDWVPVWGTNEGNVFKAMPDLPPESGYREFEIDLPTGRLLMNDWFRIPGFREAVDTKDFSIDTSWSHNERVKHYASQGWILLPSGNCSVHVFSAEEENTDHLVFNIGDGSWWDNETDTEHYDMTACDQGTVCCEMWAVSVIDYQVLSGLLQSHHGDKTDDVIEEWIENEMEGFELDVTPGRYRISYGLRDKDFTEIAGERNIELYGCREAIFTMTKVG
jgi:hypothetical protein